jgi:hypothetical protein
MHPSHPPVFPLTLPSPPTTGERTKERGLCGGWLLPFLYRPVVSPSTEFILSGVEGLRTGLSNP